MLDLQKVYIMGFSLTLVIVVMLAAYAVYEPQRMATASQRLTEEKTKLGSEVFADSCASCHGTSGEGIPGDGPTLNSSEFLKAADNEFIAKTIKNGRPGTAMPAWGEENSGPLRPDQIDDLVTFIRSWEATAPPTPKATPAPTPTAALQSKESGSESPQTTTATTTITGAATGEVQHGQQLFSSQGCVGCHKINGKGGDVGPDLTQVGTRRDADWLTQWLRNPKPPMSPSSLGEADLQALVSYLSSMK